MKRSCYKGKFDDYDNCSTYDCDVRDGYVYLIASCSLYTYQACIIYFDFFLRLLVL